MLTSEKMPVKELAIHIRSLHERVKCNVQPKLLELLFENRVTPHGFRNQSGRRVERLRSDVDRVGFSI